MATQEPFNTTQSGLKDAQSSVKNGMLCAWEADLCVRETLLFAWGAILCAQGTCLCARATIPCAWEAFVSVQGIHNVFFVCKPLSNLNAILIPRWFCFGIEKLVTSHWNVTTTFSPGRPTTPILSLQDAQSGLQDAQSGLQDAWSGL